MSDQYGWMNWGGGQAHGPFDSYDDALKDAISYLGDDDEVDITINKVIPMSSEKFVSYLPSVDMLVEDVSEHFGTSYGFPDEDMFTLLCRDKWEINQAQKEFEELLKKWAKKWVDVHCNWWLEEDEKITINSNGVVPSPSTKYLQPKIHTGLRGCDCSHCAKKD